jgi:hypothetical protein
MNAKYLVAALAALLGTSSAFAQATAPTTGVTRAQVMAEIVQARADGTLPLTEAAYLQNQLAPIKQVQSSAAQDRSRADRNNAPAGTGNDVTPAATGAGAGAK